METSKHYKSLVVEDDFASRQYMQLLLKMLEIEPVVAENGEKALEMINGQDLDIFLLDIALGTGIDGLQLCEKLKEDPRFAGTPAIAVTAFSQDKLPELESVGFVDYLPKPYSREQLRAMIDRYLEHPEDDK